MSRRLFSGLRAVATFLVVPAVLASSPLTLGDVAHAQCPSEPPLQNYTGAGTVACPCFVPGEVAAVVLDAPAAHYPIEILKIGIGWGSQFGGTPQSLEQAVHIYANGLPNPGAPQFSLLGPVLTDGAINVFDVSLVPGNKIINAGPFAVGLEFLNQNAGNPFAASVVHDGNGCQPGANAVLAIPGGWSDACVLGVTGDWVMYVEYRQLNCCPPCSVNCPLGDATGVCGVSNNRSPDLDADGAVGIVDVATFALFYPPNPYSMCVDFDCNGIIDLTDLSVFAQHYSHVGVPGVCN